MSFFDIYRHIHIKKKNVLTYLKIYTVLPHPHSFSLKDVNWDADLKVEAVGLEQGWK